MTSKYYENAIKVRLVDCFGLVDPDDKNGKKPARISYDKNEMELWNATVDCGNKEDYMFVPVDNNIAINGKRCDVLLYTTKSICFIELKIQKANWLTNAILQLESTIMDFGTEIARFEYKKAYACNKKHPYFNHSFKETMQRFYQKNHVILRLSCFIEKLK